MRFSEIICEVEQRAISYDVVLNGLKADLGAELPVLYHKLKLMAESYVVKNGSLKNFKLVAGAEGGRWMSKFYEGLARRLSALRKYNFITTTPDLDDFLALSPQRKTFSEVTRELPDILLDLIRLNLKRGMSPDKARQLKELGAIINDWIAARDSYLDKLRELKSQYPEEDEDEPAPKPVKKDQLSGSQNAAANAAVEQALKDLPKDMAGKVRNALARYPNKLQALRDIMSGKIKI